MAEVKNATVDVEPEELKDVKEAPKEEQKEAEETPKEEAKKDPDKEPAVKVSDSFKAKLKTFGKMALAAGIGAGATFAAIKLYGWRKGVETAKHAVDAGAEIAATKAIEAAPTVIPAAASVAAPVVQGAADAVADHAADVVANTAEQVVETVAQ